ncbi:hypothetical protein AGMMS50230_17710 [Spirochaetia bacterium]|nr:hypothetical protein AGMMS50230_17710 [Spirochaetia bacterium]
MELRVLELFAAFFLFLSIIRPLVRGLWKLDGLAACPLLALAIMAGIFPAYGFRPECIPLLGFALFLSFANFSDLGALFLGLQSDSFRDKGLIFTLASAAAFAFTLWITLQYAPPMDMELSTQGVERLFLRDQQGAELYLRIYGPETAETAETDLAVDEADLTLGEADLAGPGRPLLILLPPVAGSFTVSDTVCLRLRDRGFTVLSYSRPGFDSPSFNREGMPVRLFIPGLFRLGNSLIRGRKDAAANAGGRDLEAGRQQDTEFLLLELRQNKTLQDKLGYADRNTIFLAGYGAGGAALTRLSGQDTFAARFPQVRGIVAVEAPLLSSLAGEPRVSKEEPRVSAFFQEIETFFQSLVPRKITHISNVPQPGLPVLFILSGRVIEERAGRYETILRTMGASRNMALLAAVPGAGPFDYSDSPRYYPLLSVLFRGADGTEFRGGPELTASLITNFAALILENGETVPEASAPLEKTPLEGIHVERGGVWQNPSGQTILQP